jgi:hypothetical protein
MKNVIHKYCGGVCGKYKDDTAKHGALNMAINYIRKDGTSPKPGESLNERCPVCMRQITNFDDLDYDDNKSVWS